MDLFIFGTLLHLPLLARVSGQDDIADHVEWAVRSGFVVSRVRGHVFPMMHADPDQVAEGIIVSGLDEAALARLDYYEKAFGYDRVRLEVLDGEKALRNVTAYMPEPDRWQPAEPWDRDGWIAKMGALTVETAGDAMALMDHLPAQDMGQIYPSLMSRAASRLRAREDLPVGDLGRDDVVVQDLRKPYNGFFSVEEADLTFARFDGTLSPPVNRSVFINTDCAVVLPYDPVRDRVLLIEQFRPGAYLRGDPNPWTKEPVAGRIDPGETPTEAARREAEEEAGIAIKDLHCISASYPSPGSTTEFLYIYAGLCDLPDGTAGLGGKASEDEDIRSHLMTWAQFDAALNAGAFRLLPLIVAGHWLARNRDRLRAAV